MDVEEHLVRQLENFILYEHELERVGEIPFEHEGQQFNGYPYLRASNRPLINALSDLHQQLALEDGKIRFLEIGCGMGTKCELARRIGMHAVGIDLLPEYVELAKQVFPKCEFAIANALTYDYHGFDLVYYHVPFFEDRLLHDLELRVLTQIGSGAVMIATRITKNLEKMLDGSGNVDSSCRVRAVDVDADVGRLVIVQKI